MLAQTWSMSFSATVLLAAMATLGYVLGRRKVPAHLSNRSNTRQEITRALSVAQELEAIAYRLRKSMAFHVPSFVKFNSKLRRWEKSSDVSWHELCDHADDLLKPAMRLSTEISHAYADLLQQMTHLSTFAEMRTDPLTGVLNRRAFDESLDKLLAAHNQPGAPPLAIAMLDLDHFKRINDEQGHLAGDRVLQDLTQILRASIREGDVLARFGGEEFVILMPRTDLAAACGMAERIRTSVHGKLETTVSLGVAENEPPESATSLIARADAALYAAKKEGRNRVGIHEGRDRVTTVQTEPARSVNSPPLLAPLDNPLLDSPATIPFLHSEAS